MSIKESTNLKAGIPASNSESEYEQYINNIYGLDLNEK